MASVRSVAVLFLVLALPAVASAQGIANSLQELRLLVRPGDRITVTDTAGQRVSGRIAELSPTSLALLVEGRRRDLAEAEVVTITHRHADSLANGALIGLGVGAGFAAVGLALLANDDGYDDDLGVGEAAAVVAIYGGIGAGIGTGIDALITRQRVIFERRGAPPVTLGVAPQFGPRRAGARLTLGF
jgi:hypothetical protein